MSAGVGRVVRTGSGRVASARSSCQGVSGVFAGFVDVIAHGLQLGLQAAQR